MHFFFFLCLPVGFFTCWATTNFPNRVWLMVLPWHLHSSWWGSQSFQATTAICTRSLAQMTSTSYLWEAAVPGLFLACLWMLWTSCGCAESSVDVSKSFTQPGREKQELRWKLERQTDMTWRYKQKLNTSAHKPPFLYHVLCWSTYGCITPCCCNAVTAVLSFKPTNQELRKPVIVLIMTYMMWSSNMDSTGGIKSQTLFQF